MRVMDDGLAAIMRTCGFQNVAVFDREDSARGHVHSVEIETADGAKAVSVFGFAGLTPVVLTYPATAGEPLPAGLGVVADREGLARMIGLMEPEQLAVVGNEFERLIDDRIEAGEPVLFGDLLRAWATTNSIDDGGESDDG